MNRRSFCMLLGGSAASSLVSPVSLVASPNNGTIEKTAKGFGTTVRLLIQHASQQQARKAMEKAFAELELVESLMSIYLPDSQLSVLNRDKSLSSPHPLLVEILRQAKGFSMRTAFAFDVTVQSLWELHKSSAQVGVLPDKQSIQRAQKRVGSRNVVIRDELIQLNHDASITLNGIAQGFATDRVKAMLRQNDIQHALIDMGELASVGTKAGGESWQAGIQHPRNEDAYSAIVPLQDRCLATSGDYQTTFTTDFRAHHIFDPQTGYSPTELASVSVLAPTAIEADAWSTALLVTGVRQGACSLAESDGVDALFIRKDGRTWATDGFPKGRS